MMAFRHSRDERMAAERLNEENTKI